MVFFNELALCIRWPKYWSFSFSISPSNEYSELISFRTDWFNLLAVQRTVKSLLQHNSSKASILQHSPFLMVQFSHLYMTTWKTIALTRWTFSAKWCLCFYVHCLGLSCLLPSFPSKQQGSFNFMAVVNVHGNFGDQENKLCHCFHLFLIYVPWGNGTSWAISKPERWCCESAALNMPANLENSAVATGLEKVSFHSNPKERQCQSMFKLSHNCTHLTW